MFGPYDAAKHDIVLDMRDFGMDGARGAAPDHRVGFASCWDARRSRCAAGSGELESNHSRVTLDGEDGDRLGSAMRFAFAAPSDTIVATGDRRVSVHVTGRRPRFPDRAAAIAGQTLTVGAYGVRDPGRRETRPRIHADQDNFGCG